MNTGGKIFAFQKFFEHIQGKENGKQPYASIPAFHKHVKPVVRVFVAAGNPAAGIHAGDGGLKVDDHVFHEMSNVGDFV